MQRLRLKADGRIVELRDGQEFPLAPATPVASPAAIAASRGNGGPPAVRDLRRRARLTQHGIRRAARRAGRDHPELGAGQAHAARAGARASCRDRACPGHGVRGPRHGPDCKSRGLIYRSTRSVVAPCWHGAPERYIMVTWSVRVPRCCTSRPTALKSPRSGLGPGSCAVEPVRAGRAGAETGLSPYRHRSGLRERTRGRRRSARLAASGATTSS